MSKIKYVSSSGLTHYDEKIKKVIDEVDTSTNTKVTQTPTSTDASYPLLLSPSGQTQETNTTSYFNSGVVLNPSTKTISADIDGNAKTATSATSAATATKATQDGDGNVIADTYAEKETIALKSATGASISIADSKEAPMILNYAPVNLFSHTFATTTINGITFTANADGTITANGTATGVDIHCPVGTYTFTENDIGKTFVWSDNGATYTDWNGGPRIYIDGINGISGRQMFSKFSIEKAHTVRVYIRVVKNAVVENSVLRPMLEEGSTYHTYVPYTGYDIASCGKNLIGRVPKSTSGTRCSVEWNGDDVTVTSTVSGAWIGYSCNTRGLKPNTKYTVSIEVEASTTNIYNGIQFGNKMKFGYGLSGTVTLTDTTDANGYIYLLFLVDNKLGGSSGDYAIFKNIMLEEGDTASGYEASKSTSVTINSETVFPVNGLESYDGLTNVLNPYSATMEVTYATNEAGQGILKEIETKAKSSIYGDTTVSMGRKADTTVGTKSFAFGNDVTASGKGSHAIGYGVTASGDYSHAEGYSSTAETDGLHAAGRYSYAQGYSTIAGAECAHAEGFASKAYGYCSHSEGYCTHADGSYSHVEGRGSSTNGISSHAEGYFTTASGDCSHAEGYSTTALTNQHAQGHYNNTTNAKANSESGTSDGTAFVIGNGTLDSKSNAFRVTGKGVIYATNATVQTGADYAEYFEWSDGNPNEEDRVGYFVTFDEDNPEKIKIASKDNYILGIVSGMPNIIGNGDECWKQRYILDDFGRYIEETFEYEVEVPEVIEKEVEDEETGETKIVEEVVTHKETKIGTKWKENPEYDQTKAYIPRDERAEWSAIGMLGVLSVRDDGTCQVNGYCKCIDGGIATACEKGEGAYRVIKRVTDNIVKVVLK